jgi:hypothetical protein
MKFKAKPKILTEADIANKRKLENDFIARADRPASEINQINQGTYIEQKPWQAADDGMIKEVTPFSFRIPREEMLQLKYISEKTKLSINAHCLIAVRNYLRNELKKINPDK